MQIKADNIRLQFNESDKPEITLSLLCNRKEAIEAVTELKNIIVKGKHLAVDIKQYRAKRSLDANAYMWVLLSKMAIVLKTTKDELYLEVLDRYGVFTHIIVKPSVAERVKEEWRTVRELGEVTVNNQTGIQLQCYFGSSTYNTAEMAALIDGIISECKELNIEVLTEDEKNLLLMEWGKKG